MEGRNHNRALFILAEVKGKRTSYVTVDDRSAINVCPLQILPNLEVKVGELTKSDLVIRAYDDSTRSVEGTFVAPVKTGPIEAVRARHPSHLCFIFRKALVPCLGRSALDCALEGEVPSRWRSHNHRCQYE